MINTIVHVLEPKDIDGRDYDAIVSLLGEEVIESYSYKDKQLKLRPGDVERLADSNRVALRAIRNIKG